MVILLITHISIETIKDELVINFCHDFYFQAAYPYKKTPKPYIIEEWLYFSDQQALEKVCRAKF